jgi:hypothetical protein
LDENGIIYDVLNFHADEFTEKDLEQPTALSEPDDDCITVVERPQLNK